MAGRGIVGAGGGFGTGLLLLVGGLIVKHSQANLVAECSSGLGQLGQALDPNAATGCSGAQTLSSAATVAIWLGAIMLGFAVIGGIAMLAAACVFAAQQKPKTVVAGTVSQRRAEPSTGTGASPPSVTPSAVPSSGPAPGPACQDCGRELRPGARFCPVCGRPAADSDERASA